MDIKDLEKRVSAELGNIKTEDDASKFRLMFFGRDGEITKGLQNLRNLAPDQKKEVGASLNMLKREVEEKLEEIAKKIKREAVIARIEADKLVDITSTLSCGGFDVTTGVGHLHPITRITREVEDVFASMGFIIEDGAEVVTEFDNFDSVNIPNTHPARDMQDTFWLDNGQVLKTHTSASQNKMLRKYGNEFRAIFPGRCFRNENVDASHENTFFQVEGMMVGPDVSVANLIYFMKTMLTAVFERDVKVRLRPGFFPFVEPGFELDATCLFCGGEGCSVCKHSGWLELCPCGMVHPNVLEMGGVDSSKYHGFAFGLGLTRLAMIKYGIAEIRHFNSGNLEFLRGIN